MKAGDILRREILEYFMVKKPEEGVYTRFIFVAGRSVFGCTEMKCRVDSGIFFRDMVFSPGVRWIFGEYN